MSLLRALLLILREALVSLRRSWRVSLLAILTIAVSLFVGGLFLLLSDNLSRIVLDWRHDAKVVVYFEDDTPAQRLRELGEEAAARPWVTGVREVSSEEAKTRFAEAFPRLAHLLSGWAEPPLPPSLEIGFDPEGVRPEELQGWVGGLGESAGVSMVDDDREWLGRLDAAVLALRGLGLLLGGILLGAATFTIASVVRLTAYLYRQEIGVLRLVGATEFFIRGPFYVEGLAQGLLGGVLAVGTLFALYAVVGRYELPMVLGSALFGRFLSLGHVVSLVALGGVAGLLGAVISLRGERVEEG